MRSTEERPPGRARWALAAAVALGAVAAAAADKTRDEVIGEIAALVAERVKAEGQTALCISGFNNPFDKTKSSGAGIRAQVIQKLRDLKIEIKESAPLALTGTFRVSKGKAASGGDEIPVEQIDYVLTADSGKELLNSTSKLKGEKPGIVKDLAGVTEAAGSTVEVVPGKPKEANERVIKAIANDARTSTVSIQGTKIRPKEGSKFAVEILKVKLADPKKSPPKAQYKPAQPALRNGVAYVDLEKDDVYAVSVTNDHDFDIAVALSIDGIDMFQFSAEKADRTRFWIYKPGLTHALYGWHRAGSHFDTFLVGEYSKDSAGKDVVDDETKLSQISVEFRAAWSKASEMPADEGGLPTDGDKGLPKTVHGPDTEDENKLVPSFVGKFRGRVTIRYDRDYPDLPR